ncbi:MAG: hypothetical protein IR160_07140 [Salinibacterium sp.]|nr:hypothetical protein [Salinibacterium sp.]MBF0672342.1 hypothetical protein [Salinibacterium sp.]
MHSTQDSRATAPAALELDFVARLLRRPGSLAAVLADIIRALAPISVVSALFAIGWVETAVMMLVFLGVLLARAAALPAGLDGATSALLLAAAWFSVADLYAQIAWIDLATHFAVGAVLAALARIMLERWDAAALAPSPGRTSVASVVAGALVGAALGLALSVVWEFLEWWGHTYIDDTVNVGYLDTLSDIAVGGAGGLIAGAVLAITSRGRTR